ncbi:efflux pump protein [Rutstroemia sp. NJR-2017a BBW]|nr:efflux pump protein [Rutstroemia sp. NJR-2017a BBW]
MEKLPQSTVESAANAPQDVAVAPSNDSQIEKPEPEPDIRQDDTKVFATGFKLAVVVASVAMACFLVLLDTIIISTAIPSITDHFNSLTDVGWYASAYQFGSAAPQPLTGKIYTHFNTKWSFLVFFGIFEIGSVLCGAAVSSSMLIVGRAVAGVGAAGIINGALLIISSCAPLEANNADRCLQGLIGLTMGVPGDGLPGFYVNLPLGALATVAIVLLRIPEQTSKQAVRAILPKLHHHLDLLGFCLFCPAVLQLLLALQYGNSLSWSSSQVIGLFCGSAATFIVWLFWNAHMGEDALIPHSMVGRTTVWMSALYQAFIKANIFGVFFFLPIYFQAVKNTSAMLSGVYLLPTILPQLVLATASGAIIMKIGYVIPLAIFSTILLSVGSGLYSLLGPHSSAGEWVGFQIIAGIGSGAGLQVAIIAIQAAVAGKGLSSAMAFILFTQALGPAIILALCNLIFDSSLKSQLPKHAPHANATAIIQAGATEFRRIVEIDDLPGVLSGSSVLPGCFYGCVLRDRSLGNGLARFASEKALAEAADAMQKNTVRKCQRCLQVFEFDKQNYESLGL